MSGCFSHRIYKAEIKCVWIGAFYKRGVVTPVAKAPLIGKEQIMGIDIHKVTERQIMAIEVGLLQYKYIQDHYHDDDEDFRDVFYDFYLRSQSRLNQAPYQNDFFDLLKNSSPNACIEDIIEKLRESLKIYEFSFASKILHTINTKSPIYDSKIYKYLKSEGVDMWDIQQVRKNETKMERILHNWEVLNKWYEEFFKTNTFKDWIEWFDKIFPAYANISDVKKVDSIIFACGGF